MKPPTVSDAGRRMLQNYLDLEAGRNVEGRWPEVFGRYLVDVEVGGQKTKALVLGGGDGGAKAAAMKLQSAGLAIVRWNTERLVVITAAGRAAMERLGANR